ncbi:peptidase M14 [Flavobacteriaceae bacterium TK19130]|nr:peptidase M14 [Thermobacterium salinum]
MEALLSVYRSTFETKLRGRYITLNMVRDALDELNSDFHISYPGASENGQQIPMVKIGEGPIKVLAWSQMHGNESTTTKALMDFLNFLQHPGAYEEEAVRFKKEFTFCCIPMLNPDGAVQYTRENANGVDLNRDAQDLSQKESRVLRKVFESFQPDWCLNLHDQRSIYGLEKGNSAVITFLAPSANKEKSITPARKQAMAKIVKMYDMLQGFIPNQVGRYDDDFNLNCVGDTFQQTDTPTILFEAGHYPGDYQREKTRELIFLSYLSFFGLLDDKVEVKTCDTSRYFAIPENKKSFLDIIIRNARFGKEKSLVDIGIQYEEILKDNTILFTPKIEKIGKELALFSHNEIDVVGEELLINSHKIIDIGVEIKSIQRNGIDFTEDLLKN